MRAFSQVSETNGKGLKTTDTPRRAEGLRSFARSIGVSYDAVFRAAQGGRLKTIQFGRRRLIPADEIDRVMREGL